MPGCLWRHLTNRSGTRWGRLRISICRHFWMNVISLTLVTSPATGLTASLLKSCILCWCMEVCRTVKVLKNLILEKRYREARRMLRELVFSADYTELHTLSRISKQLASIENIRDFSNPVKVALLGVGTLNLVEPALALAFEAVDVFCEIRTADHNTYASEMLESESETGRFKPHVAVVVNSPMYLP